MCVLKLPDVKVKQRGRNWERNAISRDAACPATSVVEVLLSR
jgi:hypothetical protein